MIWIAVIIVLLVICLGLAIFAPCEKAFFGCELYPALGILSDEMHIRMIRDDLARLSESQFVDYPDKAMWGRTGTFQMFPFYMFDEFNKKNIELCESTFRMAQNVPDIKSMAFIKLGPQSVLKVHNGWKELTNTTFRCVLGLDIPANDIHACGVWVNGNAKKIEDDKWVIFDASNKHSMFNKQSKPCYFLMFDIMRPSGLGVSTYPMPPELVDRKK